MKVGTHRIIIIVYPLTSMCAADVERRLFLFYFKVRSRFKQTSIYRFTIAVAVAVVITDRTILYCT